MYCTVALVKKRLLIPASDTSHDDEIEDEAIAEAMAIIDNFLKPHEAVPLTTVPALVGYACADIAAGVMKRRQKPEGVKTEGPVGTKDMRGTYEGWFAQGIQKLNDYIIVTYYQGTMK